MDTQALLLKIGSPMAEGAHSLYQFGSGQLPQEGEATARGPFGAVARTEEACPVRAALAGIG